MPDWYPLYRAARLMHVPPWELARQPSWWANRALDAEKAEAVGEQIAADLARQKADLGN